MRWPRIARRRRRPADEGIDHERDRARMVTEQLEARGLTDPELLAAFARVPRHLFVEGENPYGDHALPLGSGQTISQPYIVARMTHVARPADGWTDAPVLEVGTGSGYQAAILAELGARVTTIERHEVLARDAVRRLREAGHGDVDVEIGDGTLGWSKGAPYRSILVTAGGPSVPQPLLEQLDRDGGRLVMPVGNREHQWLTLMERNGDDVTSSELEPVVFVPLIGKFGLGED